MSTFSRLSLFLTAFFHCLCLSLSLFCLSMTIACILYPESCTCLSESVYTRHLLRRVSKGLKFGAVCARDTLLSRNCMAHRYLRPHKQTWRPCAPLVRDAKDATPHQQTGRPAPAICMHRPSTTHYNNSLSFEESGRGVGGIGWEGGREEGREGEGETLSYADGAPHAQAYANCRRSLPAGPPPALFPGFAMSPGAFYIWGGTSAGLSRPSHLSWSAFPSSVSPFSGRSEGAA